MSKISKENQIKKTIKISISRIFYQFYYIDRKFQQISRHLSKTIHLLV
jgi:hypothetical protein